MLKRVLLYTLPLYLYGLEFLLKAVASIKSDSVAGPTLAGAALGFLLPLTELKTPMIDPTILKQLKASGASVYSTKDKSFCDMVWLFFFLSLGLWMFCIYLTIQSLHSSSVSEKILNESLLIGCIMFLVSVVLAEIKERL
jgi:hypothetical protein